MLSDKSVGWMGCLNGHRNRSDKALTCAWIQSFEKNASSENGSLWLCFRAVLMNRRTGQKNEAMCRPARREQVFVVIHITMPYLLALITREPAMNGAEDTAASIPGRADSSQISGTGQLT